SWARPLPEPCETCGKMRIPLGQDKVHCLGCDGDLPMRPRKNVEGEDGAARTGRSTRVRPAAAGGRRGAAAASASRAGTRAATAKATPAKAKAAPRRSARAVPVDDAEDAVA